jgi:23S rRNA (pseudouridine1915-N3)-methyltransferase
MPMKTTFLTVGRPSTPWTLQAVDHYTKFLSKYAQVDMLFVRAASSRAGSPDAEKRVEAKRLLEATSALSGFKVACDTGGRSFTSEHFAQLWRKEIDHHSGRALIIIGGPWGLDQTVLDWADLVWSLGPITLPHELALIVAMEQIARAFSINRGESYHR